MIDPLPTFVNYGNMSLLKDIGNISFAEEADITINCPKKDKYNIEYYSGSERVSFEEIWVDSLGEKIKLEKEGQKIPIIVLSTEQDLLPYCMKDRLVYLQDKINKEKGRY